MDAALIGQRGDKMTQETDLVENLDNIITGEESDPVEAETTEEAETETQDEPKGEETTEETEAEPKGEEKAEDEAEESETLSDDDKTESVPMSAFLGLKDKLQKTTEELSKIKAEMTATEDENAPDPIEDPEGYKAYVRQEIDRERVVKSQEKARIEHDDYDEKEAMFSALAKANPKLYDEVLEAPSPAFAAYDKAKEWFDGKVNEAVESRLAEEKAKWEAERPTKKEPSKSETAKQKAANTPNLTQMNSGRMTHNPQEDEDLRSIMGGR